MVKWRKTAAAVCAFSAAALVTPLPAGAAPVATDNAVLKAAASHAAMLVQSIQDPWQREVWSPAYGSRPALAAPDTVGSLGYDGRGYGYNRYSGQVYQSCMEDLGYGRVRPCDAGGR